MNENGGGFELVRLAFHEAESSPGFAGWLAAEGVNLALANGPQLFLVGVRADGALSIVDRQFGMCTALAPHGPDTLYLASRYQIWRMENGLPPGARTDDGHDRLFVPQTAWTTGLLGVHDLAVDRDGRVVFVNGRFSCLSGLSERLNFEPLWLPPFVSALASDDRCHLTGVAMSEGRPAYVTCAARTDVAEGWLEHRRDGGVVVSVPEGEIVCAGLSMPHSPRLRAGRLWLANGGTGELGFVDLEAGTFEPVAFVPGFARGLALHGGFAVVGASRPPKDDTFDGLDLGERLAGSGAGASCGVFVVNLETGLVEHSLVLHAGAPEVHDVAVVAATRSASAVAFQGDDIQELVTIPCPLG